MAQFESRSTSMNYEWKPWMNGDISRVLINLRGGAVRLTRCHVAQMKNTSAGQISIGTWCGTCVNANDLIDMRNTSRCFVGVSFVSMAGQQSISKTPNGSANWVSQRHQAAGHVTTVSSSFSS
jgi:hypothetical protein